jgi:putative SOS response-associated peptidase YedK
MCGRYQLDDDMKAIIERFDIDSIFQDVQSKMGEIFPTDHAPVIANAGGKNGIKILKWGIRPFFMNKDIINTRRESLFEKKFFNEGIISGRCIVPANYFYEWEKTGSGKIKKKIGLYDEDLIAFAGIFMRTYDEKAGTGTEAFSIITKEAPGYFMKIHDRVPVMLQREDEKTWIKDGITKEEIGSILDRSYMDMKIA